MNRCRAILLLSLFLGCGEGELEPGSRALAIVNGQLTSGHPTAVPLYAGGEFSCTATLIGKRTLLTAAHCVTAGESYKTVVAGVTIAVVSAVAHPSYDADAITNDVAVMRLASDAPIPPTPISSVAPSVGLPIVLIGYGCTGEQDKEYEYGNKRIASNVVKSVLADQFMFTGSTGAVGGHCYGDSGGPTFATIQGQQLQIGVHSWGPVPCGGDNYDARVDVFASWIAQQASGDVTLGPKLDATSPTVKILSPASGATVPSSLTLRAQISDDVAVAKAELLVDGISRGLTSAGTHDLPLQLGAGSHTLRLVATDTSNNSGEATVQVRVADAAADPDLPAPAPQPAIPGTPASPAVPGHGAIGGTVVGVGCQVGGIGKSSATAELLAPLLLLLGAAAFRRRL